jgi:hypothetical protein
VAQASGDPRRIHGSAGYWKNSNQIKPNQAKLNQIKLSNEPLPIFVASRWLDGFWTAKRTKTKGRIAARQTTNLINP